MILILAGPVLLDFPIDILFSPPDPFRISWGAITRPMLAKPSAPQNAIDMALTFIRKSKRPCIISGTGAKGYEVCEVLVLGGIIDSLSFRHRNT